MIYPSKNEFIKLAETSNMIPVYCDVAADMETPVSAYHKVCLENNSGYSFLLESVEGGENIARYSFLGAEPHSVFIQKNGKTELIEKGQKTEIRGKDIFEKIHNVMSRYKCSDILDFTPFVGGAVGYVSYDVINEIEETVPKAKAEKDSLELPEAIFMIVDSFIIFDRVKHTIKVVSYAFIDDETSDLDYVYESSIRKVNRLVGRLSKPVSIAPINLENSVNELKIKSNKTREEFCKIVDRTKQYILDGDIIQAVLSQRLTVESKISSFALYRALRMINPSPYMFLLNCDDFSVVGASPEVHAKCTERKMVIRPIAGTRKRGKTREKDIEMEEELLADPKERAEHIMLVDLARNDFGRIAESGTVKVDELMIIERYSHVMHIVSNVTAELDKQLESDSVMRSTFPAGTVSGAPKVRAMQIISELEKDKRGPYAGVVAYYSFNGNIDSCITIRTAVVKDGSVHIQAGAGIVADSVPELEYQETMNKAGALLRAVETAEQFEL